MTWLAAASLASGLVFAFAGLLALECATLQPFALTIDHAVKCLTAGRATKLGLVPAQLGRWFVTSGPIADGSRGKNSCCVTTRRCNFGFVRGLRRSDNTLTARLLSLGMPGFDRLVLAPIGLSPSGLPAPYQPQAFGVLAVTLVPTPRRIRAPTALAQAQSGSKTSAAVSLMMMAAHGRFLLPRDSPSGTRQRSASGASSKPSIGAVVRQSTPPCIDQTGTQMAWVAPKETR
jgi:hypothetical protein